MNYRIDLPNDVVRSLAMTQNYDALVAADQVRDPNHSKLHQVTDSPLPAEASHRF
jgi:hypothetical protein